MPTSDKFKPFKERNQGEKAFTNKQKWRNLLKSDIKTFLNSKKWMILKI